MIRPIQMAMVCLAVIATAGQMQAGIITLNATDSGWYQDDGGHILGNKNYIVRINGNGNQRNYFTFDLSSVTETIVSATLRLQNPHALENVQSTYSLFDVGTAISTLNSSQSAGATGLAVYSDLGTGNNYGSILVDGSFSPGIAEIVLNANALANLNLAAGGDFALGGALSTPSGIFTYVFGHTNSIGDVRQLVLETSATPVPEPTSLAAFSIGACITAIGAARRRRHEKLQLAKA